MKYKYFLFDWDGSVGDTLPLWFEAFKNTFSDYGKDVSYLEIGEKVIGDWEGPARFGINDLDDFFGKMEEEILDKLKDVDLNPNVLDVLGQIKKDGGKIAIVTTSKKKYVKAALKKNGLAKIVDVFLGKEDVTYFKPDPEIIFKALKYMGGKVSEAIMIGDTVKDVRAAKNAGIDSVLYFPKRYREFYDGKKQANLGATYIIEDFSDLGEVTG